MFALRFDKRRISSFWAERNNYPGNAEVEVVARTNKDRGYLPKEESLAKRKNEKRPLRAVVFHGFI